MSVVIHGGRDHSIERNFSLRNSELSAAHCVREKSNRYLNYWGF